jgi:hypothetical protein
MNTLTLPRQTNTSNDVRVSVKRLASNNGGLAKFTREHGLPYKRTWERVNRNQGDLLDLLVVLAQEGIDEPLRIAADASGHDLTPKIKFLRTGRGPAKPVRSTALELHHSCSVVTEAIEQALVDGSFDDRDRDRVGAALHGLRKKMAEIEARIQGGGR